MTQEEKQILLKELCARLPYYTMVLMGDGAIEQLISVNVDTYICNGLKGLPKPYLRPMSSMTEEEWEEWKCYKSSIAESSDELLDKRIGELHDWFYRKHIDFRGLTPRGLALEAPEGMYK